MRRSKPSLLSLFGDIANPKGINIIFLMEPPKITKANKLADIPDIFNCFADKSGRDALITKGITSWRCPQYCTRDIVVCQAKFNNSLTYLVSMYLDQDILDFPPEFRELIQKRGDCDIIIGTDSNAHSTVWNCANTDNRGEFIEDFLINNDLSCLNVGNNPTFESACGFTSIINITIANYRLATSISNWRVEKNLQISDHFRITFTINNCPNFRNEISNSLDWNFKKGDWVLFKSELELGLKKLFKCQDLVCNNN